MIFKVHCKPNHSEIPWFTVSFDHQETKTTSCWGKKKIHAGLGKYLNILGFSSSLCGKKKTLLLSAFLQLNYSTIPWPQSKYKTSRYVTRLCSAPSQRVLKTLAAPFLLWLSCVCERRIHTLAMAHFPGMGSHRVRMDGLGVGGHEEERRFGCSQN